MARHSSEVLCGNYTASTGKNAPIGGRVSPSQQRVRRNCLERDTSVERNACFIVDGCSTYKAVIDF